MCLATADAYEGDATASTASPYAGQAQLHNFNGPGDQDWIQFEAKAGIAYKLETYGLGESADTYLYVYDSDGVTLLASNDDYGSALSSQIDWQAPTDDMYYVLIRHWNSNVGGCGTRYYFAIQYQQVYLPVIVR